MVYCVCYDLSNKLGQDYTPLIDAIKSHGKWWHYLDSTWFVVSSNTSAQIRDSLKQFVDSDDKLLVFPVGKGWGGTGFQDSAYKWLHNNWN